MAYQPLAPCPSCTRHVRVSDSTCPFCGGSLSDEQSARTVPGTSLRLPRTALAIFASTVALTACSTVVSPDGGGATDTGNTTDSASESGNVMPVYGAPVPADAGVPDDNGGSNADYGVPPPRDN